MVDEDGADRRSSEGERSDRRAKDIYEEAGTGKGVNELWPRFQNHGSRGLDVWCLLEFGPCARSGPKTLAINTTSVGERQSHAGATTGDTKAATKP